MEKNKKKPTVKELSTQLGKLPPQAIEIEEVVLGALMLERDAIDNALGILGPDDFYKEANQETFRAIIRLFDDSEPVDIKTVTHKLREMGKLDLVGGAYYISQLTAKVNSAANIETHARIIKEQALKRSLIQLASEVQHEAYEDTVDVFQIMDKVDRRLVDLLSHLASNTFVHLGNKSIVHQLVDQIVAAKQAHDNNEVVGIPCGFTEIDRLTGGFRGSELIVIAARPGMGKTAFVGSIMEKNGDFGNAIGMFSLEMSWSEIGIRMIAMKSETMLESLRNGKIQEYDIERIVNKSNLLINQPIYIDDSAALTIFQIRTKARLMKKKHNIKMLIVDYLQLASGMGDENNRENEISRISRGLKQIAKELDIPVIALSQLSRAVETRGGEKKPMLSDLRESGAIEQDADMVMFLYRPEYYGITQDTATGMPLNGLGEVIIAKQRAGRTGSAWLRFIGKYTKWDDNVPDAMQEPFVAKSLDNTDFTITLPAKQNEDDQPF